MPDRVLHIFGGSPQEGIRLVESKNIKEDREYTALSYKWGVQPQPILCTKVTITGLKHGFPFFDLPQTIQDALIVTSELGFQYCWVDALCIIQDDDGDKGVQLGSMPLIYSEANVTIGATRAEGATSGFLGPRQVKFPGFGIKFADYWDLAPVQVAVPSPGYCSMAILVDPDIINPQRGEEFLASRGWCLQERLLSPRFLDFRPLQTVYQCNEVFLDSHKASFMDGWVPPDIDGVSYRDKVGEIDWREQRNLHEAAVTLSGWNSTSQFASGEARKPEKWYHWIINVPMPLSIRKPSEKKIADAWYTILRNYTSRNLSQLTDKLNGLSAIAFAYQMQSNDEYYAGIWKTLLPDALMWQLIAGSPIRPRSEKFSGPTWSWSVIPGGIEVAPDLRDAIKSEQEIRIAGFEPTAYRRDLGTPVSFEVEPLRPEAKFGEVKPNAKLIVKGHIIPVRWYRGNDESDESSSQQETSHTQSNPDATTANLPLFPQISAVVLASQWPRPPSGEVAPSDPNWSFDKFCPSAAHLRAQIHDSVESVVMVDIYPDIEMPCAAPDEQGNIDPGPNLFLLPMQEFHAYHSTSEASIIQFFATEEVTDGVAYTISPPKLPISAVREHLEQLPNFKYGSQPASIVRGFILARNSQGLFERVGLFEHKPFPAMAADRDRKDRSWCTEYYLQWFWLHEMLAREPQSVVIV